MVSVKIEIAHGEERDESQEVSREKMKERRESMESMKEIRDKVKSVQNTRKITKAMEMVAVSKMRRVQQRMRAARPYADKMRVIAAHLSHANPEYQHLFMVQHPDAKRAGLILVTTDKGLCGSLNTHILRM